MHVWKWLTANSEWADVLKSFGKFAYYLTCGWGDRNMIKNVYNITNYTLSFECKNKQTKHIEECWLYILPVISFFNAGKFVGAIYCTF